MDGRYEKDAEKLDKKLYVYRGIEEAYLTQESLVAAFSRPPAFLSELGLSGQRWDVLGRSHYY